jgi:hypothetical protein
LHLLPEEPLRLPAENKGNALRGGFGGAFRRLVCVDLRWECAECALRFSCPYTKVFNPFLPPDAVQFTGNRDIPRPFVVKPPLATQTAYAAGEALVFDLVLAGQAVDYLPYFIVAFRELGAGGFGLNRARVALARVEAVAPGGTCTPVYEAERNLVRPAAPIALPLPSDRTAPGGSESCTPPGPALAEDALSQELTLEFLTPTTLRTGSTAQHEGAIVRRPAFHHILKRLRDRVNALATFYGDGPLALDFKALGAAAERVETVRDETRWIERSRFSRRREVRHDLSGFAGRITFRGDVAPFLPLLRLGEYVHVGKNAVFGNGWMVIRDNAECSMLNAE